jgi:hypothetical protein
MRCQARLPLTSAPPASPVTAGVTSLEVRWILPGKLDLAVAERFGRSWPEVESRQDDYLLSPGMRGLSVKARGGRALEVKVYLGSRGVLDVPGRARGRLQSWRKWSFPFGPDSQDSREGPGWRPVAKTRRISRFSLGGGKIWADARAPAGQAGCTAELTEVHTSGRAWWSLAFEATGPADLLRDELEATTAHVFALALLDGVQLRMDDSRSYAEWLHGQLSADGEAG